VLLKVATAAAGCRLMLIPVSLFLPPLGGEEDPVLPLPALVTLRGSLMRACLVGGIALLLLLGVASAPRSAPAGCARSDRGGSECCP
jgi:hypothetical protein